MHNQLFEKISKKPKNTKESAMDSQLDAKTLETIKLLGKQIIDIRETIDEQAKTIDALKKEVQVLRNRQNETEANFKLSHIDQKDLAKQLRILKANVNGNQIVSERTSTNPQIVAVPQKQEVKIEEYYPNIKSSQVMQNSQTLNMIKEAMPQEATSEETISEQKAEDIAKQFIFGRMPKLLKL